MANVITYGIYDLFHIGHLKLFSNVRNSQYPCINRSVRLWRMIDGYNMAVMDEEVFSEIRKTRL